MNPQFIHTAGQSAEGCAVIDMFFQVSFADMPTAYTGAAGGESRAGNGRGARIVRNYCKMMIAFSENFRKM